MSKQSYILLIHWNGRFGNRMHQYAYGVTFSLLNDVEFWLPSDWEGTRLFKRQFHRVLEDDGLRLKINQTKQELNTFEYRKRAVLEFDPQAMQVGPDHGIRTYDALGRGAYFDALCAYHPSTFEPMSIAALRTMFEFSDEVKALDIYKRSEDRQGTYDVAHLRRAEITNPEYNVKFKQAYSVVSKTSYLRAFDKFGVDPKGVEWVSDDTTGKWHESQKRPVIGGWTYPVGSHVLPGVLFDFLEDFLRLYFARRIFRANSSFSWWAACLAPSATVYSPVLSKQHVMGIHGMEEVDLEFVEGNHPHWMYGRQDIIIPNHNPLLDSKFGLSVEHDENGKAVKPTRQGALP